MLNLQRCQDAYTELMTENKLELPAEPISKPKAKEHLKLARIYYFARVAELRAAIFEGIEDFKRIAGEIKEIKAGRWDDKLQPATAGQRTRDSTRSDAEIAAELVPPTPLDEQPPTEDAESAAEEADAPKIKSTPASRRKGRRGRPSEDLEELHVKPEEEDEPVASTSAGSPVRPSVEPSEDAGDEPTSARRGGRRSNPKSRKRKRTESVEPGSAARPSASPEVELKRPRISESVAEDDEDRAWTGLSRLTSQQPKRDALVTCASASRCSSCTIKSCQTAARPSSVLRYDAATRQPTTTRSNDRWISRRSARACDKASSPRRRPIVATS